MSMIQERLRWSAQIEDEIYRGVVTRFAPHLPLERAAPPRPAATRSEIEGICDNWIWTAGHDSLIVQAASKALDRLFPDLDQQYFLARQIGDDSHHAEFVRDYVKHRLGYDPIRQINDIVRIHWDALGDLPYRDIHSFFAWELHYELHILSRLHTERRTGQIGDPGIKQYAEQRVGPDEEVHRLRILEWWFGYHAAHAPAERRQRAESERCHSGQRPCAFGKCAHRRFCFSDGSRFRRDTGLRARQIGDRRDREIVAVETHRFGE